MTPAEQITLALLESFAGPYHVAGTDTQRARVVDEAAATITPLLGKMIADAIRDTSPNPT